MVPFSGAGATVLSKTPRSKHFPDLIDWVKSNGGNVDAVSISEFPGVEYGLRAEEAIEEGSLVCSIPRKVSPYSAHFEKHPF